MKTNKDGIQLIKLFEGVHLKPYLDPIGIPTIGIGCIKYEDGRKVTMKDPAITDQRAIELLEHFLDLFEKQIEPLLKVKLNSNQFSAVVSFVYNVGPGNFEKSTLLKKINAKDFAGAANEFARWNKAGGKVLAGLTRRREAEKVLFLKPEVEYISSNRLPDGPSEDDINDILSKIEKGILDR